LISNISTGDDSYLNPQQEAQAQNRQLRRQILDDLKPFHGLPIPLQVPVLLALAQACRVLKALPR